jgi:hypothetical protein
MESDVVEIVEDACDGGGSGHLLDVEAGLGDGHRGVRARTRIDGSPGRAVEDRAGASGGYPSTWTRRVQQAEPRTSPIMFVSLRGRCRRGRLGPARYTVKERLQTVPASARSRRPPRTQRARVDRRRGLDARRLTAMDVSPPSARARGPAAGRIESVSRELNVRTARRSTWQFRDLVVADRGGCRCACATSRSSGRGSRTSA